MIIKIIIKNIMAFACMESVKQTIMKEINYHTEKMLIDSDDLSPWEETRRRLPLNFGYNNCIQHCPGFPAHGIRQFSERFQRQSQFLLLLL